MTGLRAWLAALDPERLERLLAGRRDALWGAPVTDLDDLAERLVHVGSTAIAVQRLPAPQLLVLELVLALGRGASEARVAELVAAGPDAGLHRDAVGEVLGDLATLALAWPREGRFEVNPALHDLIGEPLGLGRPAEQLAAAMPAQALQSLLRRWGLPAPQRKAELVDAAAQVFAHPDRLRARLGEAEDDVVAWLLQHARDRFAAARTLGDPPDDSEQMAGWLGGAQEYAARSNALTRAKSAGLALPDGRSFHVAELPSEVLIALVDAGVTLPFTPSPPALTTVPVAPERVGASAAAAITEQVSVTMALLEHVSKRPLPVLKSAGGVGSRAVAQTAKAIGAGVPAVRLAVECAGHLGQFTVTGDGLETATEVFEVWRSELPARRAADLLRVWRGLPLAAALERDEDGTARPVLGGLGDPRSLHARMSMLTTLAEIADDVGVVGAETIVDLLAWRYPLLIGRDALTQVTVAVDEAERLGVVAQGALTPIGRALLAETSPPTHPVAPLEDVLSAMLPEVQSRAIVGSDLTIVVPGSPAPQLVDLLDAVAVRETRSAASAWRVTPDSIRAALDAGYAADDALESLMDVAGGVLPQPLEYLVRDVARRHGHLSVQPAGCVLISEDAALLTEVVAHRGLRRWHLRHVAPTVLVAAASAEEVLSGLRKAGYLPVAVDADGGPTVELRRLPRAQTDTAADTAVALTSEVDDDHVASLWGTTDSAQDSVSPPDTEMSLRPVETPAEVAGRLLSGRAGAAVMPDVERTAAQLRAFTRRLSAPEVTQLAYALVHGRPVQLAYRSKSGGETLRMVTELRLLDRSLYGWCHLRDAERWFQIDRILEVSAAPEAG